MARNSLRRPTDAQAPAGYTLVEVVIAMLIACVMVTSVFSVALTTKSSGGRSDRKLVAGQAATQMSSMLKNFVTGCSCSTATGLCGADCSGAGPTASNGANTWSVTNPSAGIVDACPGGGSSCYALMAGEHVVTGMLPSWFEAAPYNARVRYTVNDSIIASGRPVPQVTVQVTWDEP